MLDQNILSQSLDNINLTYDEYKYLLYNNTRSTTSDLTSRTIDSLTELYVHPIDKDILIKYKFTRIVAGDLFLNKFVSFSKADLLNTNFDFDFNNLTIKTIVNNNDIYICEFNLHLFTKNTSMINLNSVNNSKILHSIKSLSNLKAKSQINTNLDFSNEHILFRSWCNQVFVEDSKYKFITFPYLNDFDKFNFNQPFNSNTFNTKNVSQSIIELNETDFIKDYYHKLNSNKYFWFY